MYGREPSYAAVQVERTLQLISHATQARHGTLRRCGPACLQVVAGRSDAEIGHGRVAIEKASGSVVSTRCFLGGRKAA